MKVTIKRVAIQTESILARRTRTTKENHVTTSRQT